MFNYEGLTIKFDPTIGTHPEQVLGKRGQNWWYEGHPCASYLLGNADPKECEGLDPYGDHCACHAEVERLMVGDEHTLAEAINLISQS